MSIHLTSYKPGDQALWNSFLTRTHSGTILHSRRFLDYHSDRFHDESLCVWKDPGVLLSAVLPLARSPQAAEVVISHPGSTFGGLISDEIDPPARFEMLKAIAAYLCERGYRRMIYTPVPAIFGRQMDESDLRILTAMGRPLRTDLWSLIRLDRSYQIAPKRSASIRASRRKGVCVRCAENDPDWASFHALLSANLADRHDTTPVHSLAEMLDLRSRLEMASQLWLAIGPDGEIVAGSWCFAYNDQTLHTQYIASNASGRSLGAVDCLLAELIEQAIAQRFNTLSFGINTLPDGYSINTGLLKQKLRFGSGAVIYWRFEIDLEKLASADGGFM